MLLQMKATAWRDSRVRLQQNLETSQGHGHAWLSCKHLYHMFINHWTLHGCGSRTSPPLPWVRFRVWVRVGLDSRSGWVGLTWPTSRLGPQPLTPQMFYITTHWPVPPQKFYRPHHCHSFENITNDITAHYTKHVNGHIHCTGQFSKYAWTFSIIIVIKKNYSTHWRCCSGGSNNPFTPELKKYILRPFKEKMHKWGSENLSYNHLSSK